MITDEDAKRAVNTITDYCHNTTDCHICAIKDFCKERNFLPSHYKRYEGASPRDNDIVNHPQHYCQGGIETIDIIKAKMLPERFRGFLQGNVIKYVTRAEFKGKQIEDLKKAAWYLDRLIKEIDEDG